MINNLVKFTLLCWFLVTLSSCATNQKITQNSPDWIEKWESSSSFCLDGLYINFMKTKCESIQIEKDKKSLLWIKCKESKNQTSNVYWTRNIFIAIPRVIMDNKKNKLRLSAKLICSDGQLFLGKIVERVPNAGVHKRK